MPDRANIAPALTMTVLAARSHGLGVIDGVFNDLSDTAGLVAACAQGRSFGFDGKTVIHPPDRSRQHRLCTHAGRGRRGAQNHCGIRFAGKPGQRRDQTRRPYGGALARRGRAPHRRPGRGNRDARKHLSCHVLKYHHHGRSDHCGAFVLLAVAETVRGPRRFDDANRTATKPAARPSDHSPISATPSTSPRAGGRDRRGLRDRSAHRHARQALCVRRRLVCHARRGRTGARQKIGDIARELIATFPPRWRRAEVTESWEKNE